MLRKSRYRLHVALTISLALVGILTWSLRHERLGPGTAGVIHGSAALMLVGYTVWQEQLLRRQKRELMRLIDGLSDWAVVTDMQGVILHASQAVRRYGIDADVIVGMHWSHVAPSANHQMLQEWTKMVGPGTPGTFGPVVTEMAAHGGSNRVFEVIVHRMEIGASELLVGLFRDVTEKQGVERAMTQMDRLAHVAHLADGVAHNFNNIFGGIMLNTELLAQADESERAVFAGRIIAGAERGAALCNRLQTLARGEKPALGRVELAPLVTDLLSLFETKLNRRGLTLECHVEEGLLVRADAGQLRQVLLNLLFNARDAAEEHGWIRVVGRENGDVVTVSVSNSGARIPPEHMPLLFQPFFSTKTDSVQGTGLGLAVSQRLTSDMGGRLDVVSGPEQPTTFTLTLPVAGSAERTAV